MTVTASVPGGYLTWDELAEACAKDHRRYLLADKRASVVEGEVIDVKGE